MGIFVDDVIQIHIAGCGIVVQAFALAVSCTTQGEVGSCFNLFACIIRSKYDLQKRSKIKCNGFRSGVFQFYIRRLFTLCCSRPDVILTVTLDHNRYIAADDCNSLFCHFTVFSGSRCSFGIHVIRAVAALQNNVVRLIGVLFIAFLKLFRNGFFRNKTNCATGNLSHNVGDSIQLIAVGSCNLCTLIEDDILHRATQGKLQIAAIILNDVFRVAIFILRHKDQFILEVLAVVKFSVLIIFINNDRIGLTAHGKRIHLTGSVVLHGQRSIRRLKFGVIHHHGIAVHGNAAKFIARMQCILLQPVNTPEILLLPVSPGTFCQSEVIAVIGGNDQSLTVLIQAITVLIVGINLCNHFSLNVRAENTVTESPQEELFRGCQVACLRAGGVVAHAGNFHQRDRIAAAFQLQNRIAALIGAHDCSVAGVCKILELEDHVRSLPCQIDIVGIMLGFILCIGSVNGLIGTVIMGAACEVLEVILDIGIIINPDRRFQREQFHRVRGGIMEQDVINTSVRIVQILKIRFQTGEIVAGHCAAIIIQLKGFDVPFHNGGNIGRIHIFCRSTTSQDAAVGSLGTGNSESDVGEETTVYEELLRIHNREQHIEGCIGIYRELTGCQIDMNTVVQADAGDLSGGILLECVVTHCCGCSIFFNTADIVECIHPEHTSVGKQIPVQTGCCIVAILVAV